MSEKDKKLNESQDVESSDRPQSLSRRSMLRGSATALPAILTLQSGAALARSSNVITTTKYKSPDSDGSTLCLDLRSVTPVNNHRRGNKYDMGVHPSADVFRIPERDYYRKTQWGRWRAVDESAICERGGEAMYRVGYDMESIKLPRKAGGMISATALASFSSKVVVYDI